VALFRGKSHFKAVLGHYFKIDPRSLTYRNSLIEFLRLEKLGGRKIILATGADASIAQAVAKHIGLFDAVIASNGVTNQTGNTKLITIQRQSEIFDYVGDSLSDLPIFRAARKYYIAGSSKAVIHALAEMRKPQGFFR
jgi:hydroxymethylpyrimidine pyrophosphatase-like HAD family hydrolase